MQQMSVTQYFNEVIVRKEICNIWAEGVPCDY